MIQPQDGRPGMIGQQHGLQQLTATLEALTHGQQAQQHRDTQLHAQLITWGQTLARLHTWQQRLVLAIGGLGMLVLTLGGLVAWQVTHPPQMEYARALGAVDTVLVQQWSTVPKAAQEALSAAYGRVGLVPPGQRK